LFPGVTYLLQVKCLPSASSAAHCRHLQNAYITLMIIFISLSEYCFQFIISQVLFCDKDADFE